MHPAAFVADPTGDADVKVKIEITLQFPFSAGEAMNNRLADAAPMPFENTDKALVSIALVKKQRKLELTGKLYLGFKPFLLLWARRKVSIEVQAAFSNGNHLITGGQLSERVNSRSITLTGVVRMYASG